VDLYNGIDVYDNIDDDLISGLDPDEELELAITLSLLEQDQDDNSKFTCIHCRKQHDSKGMLDTHLEICTLNNNNNNNNTNNNNDNNNNNNNANDNNNDNNNNNDNDSICVVCLSEKREIAFVPCGHMVACNECSKHLMKKTNLCPICRTRIKSSLKIYT
jgi:hypothetical protein